MLAERKHSVGRLPCAAGVPWARADQQVHTVASACRAALLQARPSRQVAGQPCAAVRCAASTLLHGSSC